MNPIHFEIDADFLKQAEEHAFYESGLSAHGCFEDLDDYAKEAIQKYGRIILKQCGEKIMNIMLEKVLEKYKNDFIVMQNSTKENNGKSKKSN